MNSAAGSITVGMSHSWGSKRKAQLLPSGAEADRPGHHPRLAWLLTVGTYFAGRK